MENANEQIKSILDQLVNSGVEVGLQVAAYLDGKLIVDACAGVADQATGRSVSGDTLFVAASCTKGIVSTCIHILADKGVLDYDTPIVHFWPEFAANGKELVTVRHVLSHTAGIPQLPDGITLEMMCDWEEMCTAIAALPPLWEPGSKTGYHAMTFGWILGEVVRRVDSRPISQFVRDEICLPLGISDIYLGIPDDVEDRVATCTAPPPPPNTPAIPPELLFLRTVPLSMLTPAGMNRSDLRRACIPSAFGIMNARSLARHYDALIHSGKMHKNQVLSQERVSIAIQLQTENFDEVVGPIPGYPQPCRKALGYWLGGPRYPAESYHGAMGLRDTTFGHPGAGGMVAFADLEQRFSFALLKNLATPMWATGPDSAYIVANAVRTALGLSE